MPGFARFALGMLLLLVVEPALAWSQHPPDTELWDELDVSARVSGRATLTVPFVARNSTSFADPQLYGLGPFLDIVLSQHLTVTTGYLFVGLPTTELSYKAHVPLAAVTVHASVGRLRVSDRNRAEGLIGIPRDPIRYRNKLVLSYPLHRETWKPFLSDEAFYDCSQAAWSQNRFQAGLGRALGEQLRLDLFYLERNVRRGNPTATHAIGTTLEWKLRPRTRRGALPHEEN